MRKPFIPVDTRLQILFDQMPGCWGCKDRDSIFMYANKEYTKTIGIGECHLDIIGKTDFDMPCGAVKCAELFRKQDKFVIATERRIRILDIHPFAKEWKALIFTKAPLYNDEKEVIGIIFHGVDITNANILELSSLLYKRETNSQSQFLINQNNFLLNHEASEIKLSEREAECLFFLLRGKTVKLIARYLSISPRTIEEHMIKLKVKFSAQNKYELIDKAIAAGFFNIVPKGLLRTQLSVILKEN